MNGNTGQEWDFSSGTPVQTDYPVPSNWGPEAMNDSGVVVGSSGTWFQGTLSPTPYLASYPTLPIWPGASYTVTSMTEVLTDINDGGQTSGDASAYCQPSYSTYASGCGFAVQAGLGGQSPQVLGENPTNLIDIDCEYDDFYAVLTYAIAGDGTVYGYSCWSGGNPVALHGQGAPQPLQNFPPTGSITPQDVNYSGEIATNGDLWNNGANTALQGPDGSTLRPQALNDDNVIVGADDESSAVVWTPEGSTTLQDLTDGAVNDTAVATGIDDHGDIVGYQQIHGHALAFLATPGVPKVTDVEPGGGPMAGGTTVTITGTDFTDATEVDFAVPGGPSVPATSMSVVSDTEITATTPDMTSAAGGDPLLSTDVRVVGPDGTSAVDPNDLYDFGAPVVTAVVPAGGPVAGGNAVVIEGSGFANPAWSLDKVDFLPALSSLGPLTGLSASVVSDTEIDVTAPDATGEATGGALGTHVDPVFDLTGGGGSLDAWPQSPGDDAYAFGTPVISSVEPVGGPIDGGNQVVIHGTGFTDSGLDFIGLAFDPGGGASPLPGVDPTVVSDTEIDVTAPDASRRGERDDACDLGRGELRPAG